jgi:prenyl protein peptidase
MYSIAAVCATSWLPVYLLATRECKSSNVLSLAPQLAGGVQSATTELLGLRWLGFVPALAIPFCLTATLFAAPLLLLAIDISSGLVDPLPSRLDLLALRDYVFAPVTEEWAFRACMVPALCLDGWSFASAVAVAPIFFGAAHLHHVHEAVVYQGRPLRAALIAMCFQMTYTTVFGWYASWLFVRTGHLAAPVAAHAFCNLLGFPDFLRMSMHRYKVPLLASLVLSILIFSVSLAPLTEPHLYGWDTGFWRQPCLARAVLLG